VRPDYGMHIEDVVVVTEDFGIAEAGECLACGAKGWLETRYGFPSHVKNVETKLKHEAGCPVNALLNDDGSLKK